MDPDLTTDEGCVRYLRLGQQARESVNAGRRIHTPSSEEIKAHLVSKHPSTLPSFFFVAGPPLVPPKKTPHGLWVKLRKQHVMVRAAGPVNSRPSYIGMKMVHEFRPDPKKKKKEVCLTLVQYQNMREEALGLAIEEEMTLCKVGVKEEDKSKGKLVEGFGGKNGKKRTANFGEAPIHLGSSSNATAFPSPAATFQPYPGAVYPFTNGTNQLDTQILLENFEWMKNFGYGPASKEQYPGVLNPFTSNQPDTNLDGPSPKEDPLPEDDIGNYLVSSPGPEEQLPPQEEERVMKLCEELKIACNGPVQPERVSPPVRSATVRTPAGGKSDVWKYHTMIYGKNLRVVYSACNKCDAVLKAHSKKQGTKSLREHPCTAEAMAGEGSSSSSSATPQTPPQLP